MDKLKLTGRTLAEFSTLKVAASRAMHLPHSVAIQSNLELKTRPKKLWGSLLLDIALPGLWDRYFELFYKFRFDTFRAHFLSFKNLFWNEILLTFFIFFENKIWLIFQYLKLQFWLILSSLFENKIFFESGSIIVEWVLPEEKIEQHMSPRLTKRLWVKRHSTKCRLTKRHLVNCYWVQWHLKVRFLKIISFDILQFDKMFLTKWQFEKSIWQNSMWQNTLQKSHFSKCNLK